MPSEPQPMAPKTRPILTPDAGWGQAHILVQILNGDSVLWLDSRGMPRRRPIDRLDGDIAAFCQAAARCQGSLINVAIRCPGRLSYAAVETVMDKINSGVERSNSAGGNRRLVANLSIVPGETDDRLLARVTHKADTLDVPFE